MADESGVMDAVEPEIGAQEVESGAESRESSPEQTEPGVEQQAQQTTPQDDPYTTKFSREYRAAMKALELAHPEQAKFLRQARGNHERLVALTQVEPRGIDGVREHYALMNSVTYADPERGELKGPEALTAMQETLSSIEETDSMLAAGNPKAFDALGSDFDAGLAKLAPIYLERVQKTDPAAFEAAVTPYIVTTLAQSDLVKEFNALVDVLNTQNDPRFDEKTKAQFTVTQLAKMGTWLNGLAEKGSPVPQNGKPQVEDPRAQLEQERSQLERERQDLHWDTKIKPAAAQHENQKFEELLTPYQKRLRLDEAAKGDLLHAFKSKMAQAGTADADYMRQMKIYRNQKNPDPAAVQNYVKNAINKHAKTVMDSLVNARYAPFLNGKPRATVPGQAAAAAVAKAAGPVAPNVEVRTVKPPMNEIDHRNTPIAWLAMKQYRLYGGKVVRVVNQ